MNWVLRKWRLLRLKLTCWMLQAQVEHAEELLADHERRYHMLLREYARTRRRILTLESPDVLLQDTR